MSKPKMLLLIGLAVVVAACSGRYLLQPAREAMAQILAAAPRSVPAALIEKLSAGLRRVLSSKGAAEEFKKLGIGMVANSPAEAVKFIASETEKWDKVIKAAGMQID